MGQNIWKDDPKVFWAKQRRQIINNNDSFKIPNNINQYREYIETRNGNVLNSRCYIPRKELIKNIKGMICFVLGYSSHCNWQWISVAIEWCKLGYIVFMHDSYGHGLSQGLWIYTPSMNDMINDYYDTFEWAKKTYTPPKHRRANNFSYFIMGVSLGGNIALRISLKYQNNIKKLKSTKHINVITTFNDDSKTNNGNNNNNIYDNDNMDIKCNSNYDLFNTKLIKNVYYPYLWKGMILLSPMVKIDPELVPGYLTTFLMKNFLLPYIPYAPLVKSKKLEKLNTRDPNYLKLMEMDPLNTYVNPRLKTGWEILKAAQEIQNRVNEIDMDFYVLHGGGDRVTDPNKSMFLHRKAKSKNKKISIVPDAWHALFFDLCKDMVYKKFFMRNVVR